MSKKGKVGFTVRLKDRVAVVTGAASGIGKQIAIVFAKGGARGAVSDIDLDGAKATAEEIKAGNGVAFAMKTNVALEEDIQALIDTTVGKYGTVDILVNNAGIMDDMEPAGDIEDRNWERIFTVNTTGVMRTTRKVLPIMLEKGKGVIINVASAGGLFGARAGVAYTASKHAVIGFTKNTGFMYAQKGIRCNAIAPGAVITNIGSTMTNINQFGISRQQTGMATNPRAGEAVELFVSGSVVYAADLLLLTKQFKVNKAVRLVLNANSGMRFAVTTKRRQPRVHHPPQVWPP